MKEAHFTQVQTELLLDEGIVPQGKPLEHINMVKDHHEALKFVLNNKSTTIPMEYIQEINAKVLRRTGGVYFTALGNVDSSKGEFRKGTVFAGKHTLPSYNKIPDLLKNLLGSYTIKPFSRTKNRPYYFLFI